MVSFIFAIMKHIVGCPGRSRFPVKLICGIAFASASSVSCLLISIATNL